MAKRISESEAEREIKKFFGEDSVFFDGNIDAIGKYEAISTGSPSLDEAIGIGGIPRGRITQLAGKESSGKTMLSLSCIKSYLDDNPNNTALFIDAEYTYDPEWATSQGVDTSRVMVIKTNDAKQIFEGLLGTVKVNSVTKKLSKKMKGILDYVEEGTDPRFKDLGIIVLDSIAVLNTPLELAADIGKANMAPIPRFLSTELKKLTPQVAKANVAFIGINQVRVNLGQHFGDPATSPGGKALKHACSLMINMAPMFGADNIIKDKNDSRIGHRVRAKVEKNKVGKPFQKAEYFVEYLKGVVNTEEEVFNLALKYDLIERPNSQNYIIDGEKIRGRDTALEAFAKNKAYMNLIEEKIRDTYLGRNVEAPTTNTLSEDVEVEENPLIMSIGQ
jgi:recombination protein RecA